MRRRRGRRCLSSRIAWPTGATTAGDGQQSPLIEPGNHNAIYDLTRWANWELVELTDGSVHLTHHLRQSDRLAVSAGLRPRQTEGVGVARAGQLSDHRLHVAPGNRLGLPLIRPTCQPTEVS